MAESGEFVVDGVVVRAAGARALAGGESIFCWQSGLRGEKVDGRGYPAARPVRASERIS